MSVYSSTSSSASSSSTSYLQKPALFYMQQQPVSCYRRMTPEEDLMATLMGIDVLVRQRQELVDKLVKRHHDLSRKNEIGDLVQFSKEIDRIMKIQGLTVVTPELSRKFSSSRNLSTTNESSFEAEDQTRMAVQDYQDDSSEFHLRNMEPKSGMRHLQKMLNLKAQQKKLYEKSKKRKSLFFF